MGRWLGSCVAIVALLLCAAAGRGPGEVSKATGAITGRVVDLRGRPIAGAEAFGDAQVWFTNDGRRLPVLVKTRFAKLSLTLALQSATPQATGALASR